ncbi:MAG: hypothetical protein M3401_06435 [Actinomycetota bacterium]|nr:hypothetical protein [Actinomycetota bacterium]
MDRLIQQAFADMDDAAAPYFDGAGNPRVELGYALARFVAVANRNGPVLMLAAHLYGEDEHMPSQWEPHVNRFIAGAEHASRATSGAASRRTTFPRGWRRRRCARWSSAT